MSRLVFAGTPPIAAQALRAIIDAGFEVSGVLTRPDAPYGRKRIPKPSAVAATASDAGIPVLKADRMSEDVDDQLSRWAPSVGVVVAYGRLLPQRTLEVPRYGWVNLHYSALPKYRGAAPVQHAILNGEASTAATLFQLETGMDTGPIHGSVPYAIPEMTSAGSVLTELTDLGTHLLIDMLPRLMDGTSKPVPQQGEASYAPKLGRKEAYIDPAQDAREITNRINATIPEPGAWTLHGTNRLKLGVARLHDGRIESLPGEVSMQGQQVILAAGDQNGVVLSQVQPAGKQMMNAADWLRGQPEAVRLGVTDE